ncbi:MAG: DUF2334 domain-containing protein [Deltaproteobacteria bacterium]|nr:DUF2334 domain-containing protein [Deltaproteobacteria bacterium]MBW2081921.1 DUF2334 domain-containing protein [Deltaproteobacteria bacterium]HDM99899.1 DUF2334 domain-containing protein [Deltaproteobacteria bacterium]
MRFGLARKDGFFFRIDDVGNWSSDLKLLCPLVEKFIQRSIPFSLQVIPTTLSKESADYIKTLKKAHPNLVEIGQHGYSHDLEEFSHTSGRARQRKLIEKGRDILIGLIGYYPVIFTPPEHIFTDDTISVVDELEFKVFSKQLKPTLDGKVFYWVGRLLRRNFLAGKKVSYHGFRFPLTRSVVEISISVESSRSGQIKPVSEVSREILKAKKTFQPVGILIHHSNVDSSIDMDRIVQIIDFVKELAGDKIYTMSNFLGQSEERGKREWEETDAKVKTSK